MSEMKYFEFNKHEYWAIVAAEDAQKAFAVYVAEVGGDSITQIIEEGYPAEVSKDRVLGLMLMVSAPNGILDGTVESVTKELESRVNTTVLITNQLA